VEAVAKKVVNQPFGHLGTAGVVGAEKEYMFFHANDYIRFCGYIKLQFG
jgi:hypothetical protein